MTTHKKNIMLFGLGLLLVSGLLLIGCSLFEEDNSATSPTTPALEAMNATYGHEGGVVAQYQPGSTPGIEILADFAASKTHKEDQPWGDWTVDAYWRREARTDVITAFSIAFTIDDRGQGRALIPAWFLDAVFADAAQRYQQNGDTSTWHHSPGLYLQILPVGDTEDYYDFDPNLPEGWTWKLNSWAVGGSLEALVQALRLGWYPGLKALMNVAVSVNIGDPIGIEQQPPASDSAPASASALDPIDVFAKGKLSFILTWNCPDGISPVPDIDLHVTSPAPENCHIWWQAKTPACTQGLLDLDDTGGVTSNGGPERIYWPDTSTPPPGTYTYGLDFYSFDAGECANPTYTLGVYKGTTRIKTDVGTLTNNGTPNTPDEFSATFVN